MLPQLRMVGDQPSSVLQMSADARLRLWGAAVCAVCALSFTYVGYERALPALVAGPFAAAFVLWSAYLLLTYAGKRAVRYTLTAQRFEIEKGVLGKRYESIELWRVRDVVLEQGVLERLRGVGRITVFSSDQVEPVLRVGPVGDARNVFETLRNSVAVARKDARVLPLDAGPR